jgi:hypothetical protein
MPPGSFPLRLHVPEELARALPGAAVGARAHGSSGALEERVNPRVGDYTLRWIGSAWRPFGHEHLCSPPQSDETIAVGNERLGEGARR